MILALSVYLIDASSASWGDAIPGIFPGFYRDSPARQSALVSIAYLAAELDAKPNVTKFFERFRSFNNPSIPTSQHLFFTRHLPNSPQLSTTLLPLPSPPHPLQYYATLQSPDPSCTTAAPSLIPVPPRKPATMAERYIPEHRRTQFKAKNTFKPEELRRRREEQQVEIRKAKREENLAKRRGITGGDGTRLGASLGAEADSDDDTVPTESQVRDRIRFFVLLFLSTHGERFLHKTAVSPEHPVARRASLYLHSLVGHCLANSFFRLSLTAMIIPSALFSDRVLSLICTWLCSILARC